MTKKQFTAYEISKAKDNKMKMLIKEALNRYDADELLGFLTEITTGNSEEYLKDKMVSELTLAGYCIFKPEMTTQADKLKEYAETYIFPYYNEQQSAILF